MEEIKYYKYPHFPSNKTRVINCIPGEIVYDSFGNIYEILDELEGFNFKKNKIVHTVLKPGFRVDEKGLTPFQFSRLFVVLNDKEINKIFDNV